MVSWSYVLRFGFLVWRDWYEWPWEPYRNRLRGFGGLGILVARLGWVVGSEVLGVGGVVLLNFVFVFRLGSSFRLRWPIELFSVSIFIHSA